MDNVVPLSIFLAISYSFICVQCELCATPNSTEGECIDISRCTAIWNVQHNFTRLSDKETQKYLHRSQCGFDGLTPKVCCPKSGKLHQFSLHDTDNPSLGSRFGDEDDHGQFSKGGCGIQYTNNRIFDGTITEIDEFPWMALLIYQTVHGPALACGGVLISNKYVLTAAHCVKGRQVEKLGKLIAVRLGEHDLQSAVDCDDTVEIEEICAPPPIDVSVAFSLPYPDYNTTSVNRYHDIALIRLANPVNFTKYIQPICLPSAHFYSTIRDSKRHLVICGWGKTEKAEGSPIKLKARVPLVEEDECKTPYEARGVRLAKTQLCAGDGKHDSCKGDSGGPLMVEDRSDAVDSRWTAVGVISFGPSVCAKQDVPAVYTNISPYLDWIKETMKP